ncbi:MAG: hypothetical protein M1813_007916 [Trichoglossum hirsutum]|nr:MAG: hypothetical protein M1813_007916 [Trichoglossum hirsutum]
MLYTCRTPSIIYPNKSIRASLLQRTFLSNRITVHNRKGDIPIREGKARDSYFDNPRTVVAWLHVGELTGEELKLHRARGADRKARHKALKKLRESTRYKDATAEDKEAMELQTIDDLEEQRSEAGISASVLKEAAENRAELEEKAIIDGINDLEGGDEPIVDDEPFAKRARTEVDDDDADILDLKALDLGDGDSEEEEEKEEEEKEEEEEEEEEEDMIEVDEDEDGDGDRDEDKSEDESMGEGESESED